MDSDGEEEDRVRYSDLETLEDCPRMLFFGHLPPLDPSQHEEVKEVKTILFGRVPRVEKLYFHDIKMLLFGKVPRIESLHFNEVYFLVNGTVPPIKSLKTELVRTIVYGRVPSLRYCKFLS